MSVTKLSDPLKRLINAATARPGVTPAPPQMKSVLSRIADEAKSKNVGVPAWLTFSTAATFTMNSPASTLVAWDIANSRSTSTSPTQNAELVREAGLKCITLNGVARTINCLGGFRAGLPQDIASSLSTTPTRNLEHRTPDQIFETGKKSWKSFYQPFDQKLADKLAQSHPDMAEYIIGAHYGSLLGNSPPGSKVGRVLTSVVAMACLRAQTGVGPQLISHVFGLRKAYNDGTAEAEEEVEGGKWLASDEGSMWLLEKTDEITSAIGENNFAPGAVKAKL